MKILAFVDMHGSHKALEKIKEQSKRADIIVCAGDISIFENNLDKLLSQLNKLGKPVLIIPGNHESEKDLNILTRIFDNIIDINEKSIIIDNYIFLGYGNGGFSMEDRHFDKIGRKFEKKIKKFLRNNKRSNKKIILITHAPPYKTKIDKIMDEYCGNKDIRKFIDKIKPNLVISGHLHENAGKEDKIKNTKIVNPGPFGGIISI